MCYVEGNLNTTFAFYSGSKSLAWETNHFLSGLAPPPVPAPLLAPPRHRHYAPSLEPAAVSAPPTAGLTVPPLTGCSPPEPPSPSGLHPRRSPELRLPWSGDAAAPKQPRGVLDNKRRSMWSRCVDVSEELNASYSSSRPIPGCSQGSPPGTWLTL